MRVGWVILPALFASPAYAASSSTVTIDAIASLIVAGCYLVGIMTFIYGIYGFKAHSSAPQQFPIATCVMNLLTGVFLLSMPTFYGILKRSTIDPGWNDDSRKALSVGPHVDDVRGSFIETYMPGETANAIIGFIFLVGLYNFAKGIYKLRFVGLGQMHAPQGQGAGLGNAFTHMIGGMLVMNITTVSCIIGETFNFDILCMG